MVQFRVFVTYEPYLACTFFLKGSRAKVYGRTILTVGYAQGTRSLCACPSWSLPIGYFRVPKTLTFRGRPTLKQIFIYLHEEKNHFHVIGFALSLVLKQRLWATRKWQSTLVQDITSYQILDLRPIQKSVLTWLVLLCMILKLECQ